MKKQTINLEQIVLTALEDLKGQNILSCNVRELTEITETMIFCTGTSSRHVKSLADNVVKKIKGTGFSPLGIEGEREGEWILIDLGEAILHVMLEKVRAFYDLEKLWDPHLARNTENQ